MTVSRFPSDLLVSTPQGLKRMDELLGVEYILTKDNQFKRIDSFEKMETGELLNVKIVGFPSFYIGSNNKLFATHNFSQDFNTRTSKNLAEGYWIEAENLSQMHFVAVPFTHHAINDLCVTKEEAWLIGKFLAKGRVADLKKGKYNLMLCIDDSISPIKEYRSVSNKNIVSMGKNESYKVIYVQGPRIDFLFNQFNLAKKTHNREIPSELMNLPIALLKTFFESFIEEYGVLKIRQNSAQIKLSSRKMAYQLGQVFSKIYRSQYSISEKRNIDIKKSIPSYKKRHFVFTMKFNDYSVLIAKNIIWRQVEEIRKVKDVKIPMFRLSLRDSKDLIGNNLLLLNSQEEQNNGEL